MKSRYINKYNAFVDSLYIEELCDTNNFETFIDICNTYGYLPNFYAYANHKRIDSTFLIYIDIENEEEINKAEELINWITL